MKKKILSLILCSALALSSAITANAKEITDSAFTDLKTQYQIPDNTLLTYSYNIDTDYSCHLNYKSNDETQFIEINFTECIETPKLIKFTKCNNFYMGFDAQKKPAESCSGFLIANQGGTYRKVKIKLSDFSEDFNEDGSHTYNYLDTTQTFTENFKKKYDDNGAYYNSTLFIRSGAAHTAVIPNENGEVEFYLYLNPLSYTSIYYDIKNPSANYSIKKYGQQMNIYFGDVNQSCYVDVNDVTQIQLALSGAVTLDTYSKFNADINLDGIRDIKDATALQLALASKSK